MCGKYQFKGEPCEECQKKTSKQALKALVATLNREIKRAGAYLVLQKNEITPDIDEVTYYLRVGMVEVDIEEALEHEDWYQLTVADKADLNNVPLPPPPNSKRVGPMGVQLGIEVVEDLKTYAANHIVPKLDGLQDLLTRVKADLDDELNESSLEDTKRLS